MGESQRLSRGSLHTRLFGTPEALTGWLMKISTTKHLKEVAFLDANCENQTKWNASEVYANIPNTSHSPTERVGDNFSLQQDLGLCLFSVLFNYCTGKIGLKFITLALVWNTLLPLTKVNPKVLYRVWPKATIQRVANKQERVGMEKLNKSLSPEMSVWTHVFTSIYLLCDKECQGVGLEVRRWLAGIISLLPPCEFQESNSACQSWPLNHLASSRAHVLVDV